MTYSPGGSKVALVALVALSLARMEDLARRGVAITKAPDKDEGEFMAGYEDNVQKQTDLIMGENALVQAVISMRKTPLNG
jgi:hypothetical protein